MKREVLSLQSIVYSPQKTKRTNQEPKNKEQKNKEQKNKEQKNKEQKNIKQIPRTGAIID